MPTGTKGKDSNQVIQKLQTARRKGSLKELGKYCNHVHTEQTWFLSFAKEVHAEFRMGLA
ncbi:MAG: hypothetical protein KC643_00685 [Nitrospira sp.]|nr:hypothetical protein [Nitrospira sp.]